MNADDSAKLPNSEATVHELKTHRESLEKQQASSITDIGLVDAWVDGWLECLHEHDIDHGFTDEVEQELAAEKARKNLGMNK